MAHRQRGTKCQGVPATLRSGQSSRLESRATAGVSSDGAQGLVSYLRRRLSWVQHQRCVWHLWRNLRKPPARAAKQAGEGLDKEAAKRKRQKVREELGTLIHGVIDAASHEQVEQALQALRHHPFGAGIAAFLNLHLDHTWFTPSPITRVCSVSSPSGSGVIFA
ncbi:MAG: hypothetical protein D6775_01795 [Caldilineae bacterium]|nr:MAG: hypothetical protein D6775_01795 [Caldilineae bacterium]